MESPTKSRLNDVISQRKQQILEQQKMEQISFELTPSKASPSKSGGVSSASKSQMRSFFKDFLDDDSDSSSFFNAKPGESSVDHSRVLPPSAEKSMDKGKKDLLSLSGLLGNSSINLKLDEDENLLASGADDPSLLDPAYLSNDYEVFYNDKELQGLAEKTIRASVSFRNGLQQDQSGLLFDRISERSAEDEEESRVTMQQSNRLPPDEETGQEQENSRQEKLLSDISAIGPHKVPEKSFFTENTLPELPEDDFERESTELEQFEVHSSVELNSQCSVDSVDQLWQQALDKDVGYHEEPSELNFRTNSIAKQSSMDQSALLKFRDKNEEEFAALVDSLISFNFPSTHPLNHDNINLADYGMYLHPSYLNMAPSTDTKMTLMMSSMAQSPSNLELAYQELGCIGFYGIEDNEETLLSLAVLTNFSDVAESHFFKLKPGVAKDKYTTPGGFNNPQQFLVPDVHISQLKNVLRKLVGISVKEAEVDSLDLENLPVFAKADFGVLLLLGKLYFHLSCFRQSLYCLELAFRKCSSQAKVNSLDFGKSLVWLIFVRFIELSNKLRILNRVFTVLPGEGKMEDDITEIQLRIALEAFDSIFLLKDEIQRFLHAAEKRKSRGHMKTVILYIGLKVEILRQSALFEELLTIVKTQLLKEASARPASQSLSMAQPPPQPKEKKGLSKLFSKRKKPPQTPSAGRTQSLAVQGFGGINNTQESSSGDRTISFDLSTSQLVEATLDQNLAENIAERASMAKKSSFFKRKKNENLAVSQIETRTKSVAFEPSPEDIEKSKKLNVIQKEHIKLTMTSKLAKDNFLMEFVSAISAIDSYIGSVAEAELCFWRMIDNAEYVHERSMSQIEAALTKSKAEGKPKLKLSRTDMQKGMKLLDELAVQNPERILASVKLWQFFRTQKEFGEDLQFKEDCLEQALRVAEQLDFSYYKAQSNRPENIEKDQVITIILAKSLFDSFQYGSCFELLQKEYLRLPSYTSLLYLYGKLIVKANQEAHYAYSQEQQQFLGSGIGALEECLKQSTAENQSRVHFYIGLAYNNLQGSLRVPLKSLSYWKTSKQLGFALPYSGAAKMVQVTKFLDKLDFVDLIVSFINSQSSTDSEKKISPKRKELAQQYLTVLSTFETKFDGPSCLLLKAQIQAYTLRDEEKASNTFNTLLQKHPDMMEGYFEFWKLLTSIFKRRKVALKSLEGKVRTNPRASLHTTVRTQKKDLANLLSEIKRVAQRALSESNSNSAVSTSEWVQVRILTAKTYHLEKEFTKALHILTDLCYVIPPNKLKVGEDQANVISLYQVDENENPVSGGGIRFCNQILADPDDLEMPDEQNPFRQTALKMAGSEPTEFKNRILIDKAHEKEIQEDMLKQAALNETNVEYQNQTLPPRPPKPLPAWESAKRRSHLTSQGEQQMNQTTDINFHSSRQKPDQEVRTGQVWENTTVWNYNAFKNFDENTQRKGTIISRMDDTEGQPPQISTAEGLRGVSFVEPSKVPTLNLTNLNNVTGLPKNFQTDRTVSDQSGIYAWEGGTKMKFLDLPSIQRSLNLPEAMMSQNFSKPSSRFLPTDEQRSKPRVARAASINTSMDLSKLIQQRPTLPNQSALPMQFEEEEEFSQLDIEDGAVEKMLKEKLESNRRNPSVSSLVSTFSRASRRQTRRSIFDIQEFKNMQELVGKKRAEMVNDGALRRQENQVEQTSIFAVNSDVYFLYMIGKMCAKSGSNLFSGLQALNDYYLLMWHFGDHSQQIEGPHAKLAISLKDKEVDRVKECTKALACIAQIYEQLNQPHLAHRYYLKILEDRWGLEEHHGCKKYVALAEARMSEVWKKRRQVYNYF